MLRDTLLDEGAVADALLRRLRAEYGESLRYAEPPSPISGGYDTVVYRLRLRGAEGAPAGPLVARIFPSALGARRARSEALVQAEVAAAGVACPRPLLVGDDDSLLGASFVLMERVPGAPALDAALRSPLLLWRLPRLLAEVHVALHAVDPAPLRRKLDAAGEDVRAGGVRILEALSERIERHGLKELAPALAWLEARRPDESASAPVICHSDFHVANVLVERGGVTGVIDWANTVFAPAEYDVARTVVIHACGPADAPAALRPVLALGRRRLGARYVRAYRAIRPLDPDALRYYRALHALLLFALGYEVALGAAAGGNSAWAPPDVAERVARAFRSDTGLPLRRLRLDAGR